ncbi:LysR family transcriptional regulator [Coralloluteibacterium stylophorae]|uniref:LysR family transcriptional regulator n=1 Tax=Coralloluteibacterium stylophorae TaxID=1776034 RepID=A0A8J7VR17_9GAMM|nr:LysR family transcriptional regulator [Coralloluteibacterium stylophorae]MBS7457465.1 LysR family transcriptional regulator [Coralloluteibacterium stylophorae]
MSPRTARSARYYYKSDRLKPLRAFCQVARLGSVSRAADALFLSQPAVSLQLQALERDYGVPLFERIGRRLNLTAAGETLYDMARPLVDGIDGLESAFRDRLQTMSAGRLDIACGNSTLLYLMPPLVAAYRAAHADVALRLHTVTGPEGLAMLRADEVDFAVGAVPDVPGDVIYAPVHVYDPMLITPKGHPLASIPHPRLEDLSGHGLVMPPQHLTTYRQVDYTFQRARVPYTVAMEASGGWEVIKQYVAMGLGISIVSGICLGEADRDRLEARSLAEHFPQRSYGVVVRKGRYLSQQARDFIELLRPGLLARDSSEGGPSER